MTDHDIFYLVLIFLAAGVVAVPIFKRFGLGSVLGYLAAGMAIGPWGLSLASGPQAILQFAEFGVVMLLFLVGLELNPRRLWQMRRPIFGLGTVQVVATVAAVMAAGWALGAPPVVSLVAGMGFAMSSTAIVLADAAGEAPAGDAGRPGVLLGAAVPGPRGDPAHAGPRPARARALARQPRLGRGWGARSP